MFSLNSIFNPRLNNSVQEPLKYYQHQQHDMSSFVKVAPDGRSFLSPDNPHPFYLCGVNTYYLMTRAADPNCLQVTLTALNNAASAGFNVIRTWVFCEGPHQWNALQTPLPCHFDECVFQALDRVVYEAKKRGLYLLLDLVNYWNDYGGMLQYVKWSQEASGRWGEEVVTHFPSSSTSPPPVTDAFYTDPLCQQWFQQYIHSIVNRVNTMNGVRYKDESCIFAWGLANEPQCRPPHGTAGTDDDSRIIAKWAHGTAAYLKSIDHNHLVTLDSEGFFGPSSTELCSFNPYNCSHTGCDYFAEASSPHIDFLSVHLYVDLWLPNKSDRDKVEFSKKWVTSHDAVARCLKKPLVLSEFGKKGNGEEKAAFFKAVFDLMEANMSSSKDDGGCSHIAGSMYWMLASRSYPDYDGFTVYIDDCGSDDPAALWC